MNDHASFSAAARAAPAFGLSPDQAAFAQTTRRFAAEVLAPGYRACEQAGSVPLELRRQMGALGLIGVEFPAEYAASAPTT